MPDSRSCIRTAEQLMDWSPELYPGVRAVAENLLNRLDRLQGDRHRDRPLRAAIVGRFCSGKTSIINCLLGSNILPCDTDECTANIVLLRYSPKPCASIRKGKKREIVSLADAKQAIALSEAAYDDRHQVRSKHSVQLVEVGLDCDLLRRVQLIDTPGYDGTKAGHRERAAKVLQLATDNCDVVVLVVTKGIGEDEFAIIRQVHAKGLPVICLLNMSDRYDDEELSDLLAAGHDLLREHFEPAPVWFAVSVLWQMADSDERRSMLSGSRRYIGGGPPVNQWKDFLSALLRRAEETILERRFRAAEDMDRACRQIHELQQSYDLSAQAQHMFVQQVPALAEKMPPPLGPRYLKLAEDAARDGRPVPWRLLSNFGISPETIAPTIDLTELVTSLQESMCSEVRSAVEYALQQSDPGLLSRVDGRALEWRERDYAHAKMWADVAEDIEWGRWLLGPFTREFSYERQLQTLRERWGKNPGAIVTDVAPVREALAIAAGTLFP